MVHDMVFQKETGSATNTSGECLGNQEQKSLRGLCLFITQTLQIYAF
jgi:hypothetical protein